MKAAIAALVVLLAMVEARVGPLGRVYQFPISSILQCRRIDSNGDLVQESVPTMPLVPAAENTVWLPPRVPFAAPPGTIDATMLKPLLPGLNENFQSVFEQVGPCEDPRDYFGASGAPPPPRPREDNVHREAARLELGALGIASDDIPTIESWWNAISFPSCDVPTYEWTQLPEYYFPRYFCGGRCSGANCSVPLGQTCRPAFRDLDTMPMLRWDCCWDTDGSEWQWACGWREVNVPFFKECFCSCRNVY